MDLLLLGVGLVAVAVALVVAVVGAAGRRPAPIPPDLRAMREDVARLHESLARTTGELGAQLASHGEQTASLTATAGALREVLASPKARGQWGERMADDVLRLAGLVEGVSYVRQRATRHGTVPDVTFLLPGDRVLHLDVKFPIDNHVRWCETGDDAARVAFLRDVRARVRELQGRGYVDPAGGTLDYVLLFLPNEAIYSFVHEHDPALIDSALAQKVVLCSPLTLYAVLSVVRQAAEAAALERTSGEVLSVLGAFGQEWLRFCDSLDKVGRAVDSMERAYGELAGTRRRALERPLARIDELRRSREPSLRAVE
ncbi:MAG TPA: DNA recombination protein RmuC [Acidimicrobiales bacterium]|nr:DNA recombination protein RmuC [Acidimicrobiales bacterium]